jgi:hypothetical protein
MPQFSVPINGPNGPGTMTVNANDAASAVQNASQGGNYATGGAVAGGNQNLGGAAIASAPSNTLTNNANTAAVQQLGNQVNSLLSAIASGNKEAFNEAVRQFNVSFGLDKDKFTEAIRQFNENLTISQAGLTGTYQGQQTQQAQLQAANIAAQQAGLTGMFQGAPTLAAAQQAYSQQLGAITTAAGLQANPFRQAQVIGQLGNVLRGTPVAGFQAPGQAQGQTDFSGMGNMQRLIDDIRGGPGAINSQSTQGILDAVPTPNKVNSMDFYRSSPLTQNMVLQGMQEKYGLSPDDSLAQIRNTLPQFQAPTTFGGVKR